MAGAVDVRQAVGVWPELAVALDAGVLFHAAADGLATLPAACDLAA